MGHFIDVRKWKRRDHFRMYRAYALPFFSVCVEVDATNLWRRSRAPGGPSFFLATLFLLLRVVNDAEPLRLRLRRRGVWLHDRVAVGTTILKPDDTFGFARLDPAGSFQQFQARSEREISRVKQEKTLPPVSKDDDLIYHSSLPWLRFTAFTNASGIFDRGQEVFHRGKKTSPAASVLAFGPLVAVRVRVFPLFAALLISACGGGKPPASTSGSEAPPPAPQAAETPPPVLTAKLMPAGVKRVSFGTAVRAKGSSGAETCRIAEPLPDPPTFTGAPKEITYVVELDPAAVTDVTTLLVSPDGQGDFDGVNCNAFGAVAGQFGQTQLGNTISRLDRGPMKAGAYRLQVTVNGKTGEVPFYIKN